MDKHPTKHSLILFCYTLGFGLTALVYPFLGRVEAFFALMFVWGFTGGGMDTGTLEHNFWVHDS